MKRFAALILAVCMVSVFFYSPVYGFTDEHIEADLINGNYYGRPDAYEMRFNLMFSDMEGHSWAAESTARNGALNLIKGYEDMFYPDALASKGEVISHVMRALGYEKEALVQASGIGAQLPPGVSSDTLLTLAYLNLASSEDIISRQDYDDAMYEELNRQQLRNSGGEAAARGFILPAYMFGKDNPATREEIARWIYTGLQTIDDSLWESPASVQRVYMYSDWASIGAGNLTAVEAVTANGIMDGYMGEFLPSENMSRAVLSVTLANMNDIYYSITGIQKKTGVVGGYYDSENLTTSEYAFTRQVLVRTSEGLKDILRFDGRKTTAPMNTTRDAVVFKDGQVLGLQSLEEGDVIEYLVDGTAGTVLYVQVLGAATEEDVQGVLDSVDVLGRKITLREIDGNLHTYTFVKGMGIVEDGQYYFIMDNIRVNSNQLPVGSTVSLKLFGNTVVSASYIGEPVLVAEGGGVVLENDPAFGYITILEHSGEVVVKRYYENDMVVQKREYYEKSYSPGAGYIGQIFPNYAYNPLSSTIDKIEPGDLVYFRTYEDDPDVIEAISAATNYTVKFGKVRSIQSGTGYTDVLVEYENHQTAWFSIANKILVTKDGRANSIYGLVTGDWIKLLVNEAIIAPGYVTETAKELKIEGPERYISTIVKGNLENMDELQNKLIVKNAQTLAKTGWSNYSNLADYDLSGREIEYYSNGTQVSKDYAMKYYKRTNATVYIGLENSYTGERVKVVSFRDSRDAALDPDTVVAAYGGGVFEMLSQPGTIKTDAGTIVIRHGRLVTGTDIYASDYARVVLNGDALAAVVDISETPDTSMLMFARGKILSVDEGQNFIVRDMIVLNGTQWAYTPIQRVFEIDYDTLFLDESGYVDPSTFISYTTNTVLENYYTIAVQGAKATHVTSSPYSTGSVRGTVYDISENTLSLRNAQYMEPNTGAWKNVSSSNNTLQVTIHPTTLIGKNNKIITPAGLAAGDMITVMTPQLAAYGTITPDTAVDGYIITVGN